MAEAKTREEREAEWWEAWWSADYSWAGLRDKEIAGDGGLHGEKSVQDYWRADPATGEIKADATLEACGELERDPYGFLWHIAHIPLLWRDGSRAKVEWNDARRQKLAAIIAARLRAAGETTASQKMFEKGIITGQDGRAQLAGCVLLDPPAHPDGAQSVLHLTAQACWLPAWTAASCRFGPGAGFDSASFSGDVRFHGASFLGDASFDNASFSGRASFEKACFAGHASFERASFVGHVSFDSANFSGNARFTGATFVRIASLYSVSFSGDISFNYASFARRVSFKMGGFSGDASFERVSFSGHASFESTSFLGNTSFYSVNFLRNVKFDGTTFSGNASFYRARFPGNIRFKSVCFKKVVSFEGSRFETALADGQMESGTLSFHQSVFDGPALFSGASFATISPHHSAAFLGARFKDLANFRGCGVLWIAALDEAEFEKRLLLDGPDEAKANRTFASTILPRAIAGGKNPATKESLLRELEGGCRTVKVAMAKAKDEAMVQRYYRFELIARQKQPGTPWFERRASQLYGLVSDYGLSPTRPLIGLGVVVLSFAALFWGFRAIATGTAGGWDGAGSALSMSLSRIFPFGAFDLFSKEWIRSAIVVGGGLQKESGWDLTVRLLATLESLIALILTFLFGLALRRRFQIG